jgi:hypothetical protein
MEQVDLDGLKGILDRGIETGCDWDFIAESVKRTGGRQRKLNGGSPSAQEVDGFLDKNEAIYAELLKKRNEGSGSR